jgi:NADH-quinone oxidoreductase subunit J
MDFTFDPSLKFYVQLADVAFLGFAALALLGGVIATGAKRLIHAVLGLITSLVGVAGLYVYLGTHFIAAMQILIYVGAVSISLTFAVMLARPPKEAAKDPKRLPAKIATGMVVALFAGLVLGSAVMGTDWAPSGAAAPALAEGMVNGSIAHVGYRLLTDYALVFEMISLVLLVAIVGSVVLARQGRGTPGGS